MDIPQDCFLPGGRFTLTGAPQGPLAGLTFAAKDLFDVAGHPTGGGNPDWARTHPPAAGTAPCVSALLQAGAHLRGKAKTVELAYGLTGGIHSLDADEIGTWLDRVEVGNAYVDRTTTGAIVRRQPFGGSCRRCRVAARS